MSPPSSLPQPPKEDKSAASEFGEINFQLAVLKFKAQD